MKADHVARREFLGRVGQGMIVASVGTAVAEVGKKRAVAGGPDRNLAQMVVADIAASVGADDIDAGSHQVCDVAQ